MEQADLSKTGKIRPDTGNDEPRLHALWSATACREPAFPTLTGPLEADVIIVGAGFSGLSTALSLAEHGKSVVVLEAGEPGNGASGVSGGQVTPGLRHFTDELTAKYGRDKGLNIHRFGAEASDKTFQLIARHKIDCGARQSGKIQVADSRTGLADAKRRFETWQRYGAPVTYLDAPALADALGTDVYLGGWRDERGGMVQPLSLARGLATAAARHGARIFANSRALSIERRGSDWHVVTQNGNVTARCLLLATNATTDALWPQLQRSILPVWSFQVATVPLSAKQQKRILPGMEVVSDTRRVLRYFRKDTQGRLVLGGKGLTRAPFRATDFDFQYKTLARLYPELAETPIEYAWGGQVAITIDRLPRIVELGPNAYAHLGCNGKGVAWCTAIGAAFAEAFIDATSAPLPLPVTQIQPIPFHSLRRLYVGAGSAWLKFRDMLDAPRTNHTTQRGPK